MPATSISQRRYFAMCEKDKIDSKSCPDMTKEEMHKFASTKEKGLPKKINKKSNKRM